MRKIVRNLLVCFILVLLLEVITSFVIKDNTEPAIKQWWVFSLDLGWVKRPNFHGEVNGQIHSFSRSGYSLVDERQLSNKEQKIIVIGDSCTFGHRIPPNSTFAELLDELLPSVSVINLGVPGYTSYQGYQQLLKSIPQLKPSLIIVSFNFNDRRYVLKKKDIDSRKKFKNVYINKILLKISLYRALCSTLNRIDKVDLSKVYARVPPENYRENLIKIAKLAEIKKIPLIFLLLKDNPQYTKNLKKGISHFKNLQYDLAIENLEKAVDSDDYFSDAARIYLAKAYKKKGFPEIAKTVVISDSPIISLHGGFPIYPDNKYNEIMREVAKEYDIELIDVGSILDKTPSIYIDSNHFDKNGHEKIANSLFEIIPKILLEKR